MRAAHGCTGKLLEALRSGSLVRLAHEQLCECPWVSVRCCPPGANSGLMADVPQGDGSTARVSMCPFPSLGALSVVPLQAGKTGEC